MIRTLTILFTLLVLQMGNVFCQTFVSTGTLKYPLLEEGTGTWCVWCPGGTQVIHEMVKSAYPRAISVSFHNNDTMMLAGDPFNSVYAHGFPSAAVDRIRWNFPLDTGTGIGRDHWGQAIDTQYNKTPNFQVDMYGLYDSATRTLNIKVTGKALATLSGQYRINAYVVEDSIPSIQTKFVQRSAYYDDAASWYYNQCIGPCSVSLPYCINCAYLPDSVFKHEEVVRAILANGGSVFGDSAFYNPAAGDTASKTYTYVIPAAYQAKHISVVGFITKDGYSVIYDAPVENAIQAKIRSMWQSLSVNTPTNFFANLKILPNPAADNVTVIAAMHASSPTTITISNSMGKILFTNTYLQGNGELSAKISLQHLPCGIYLLTIMNNEEKVTRKLTITR